jgi:hypothetical protein
LYGLVEKREPLFKASKARAELSELPEDHGEGIAGCGRRIGPLAGLAGIMYVLHQPFS